jgi:hypothetical protein
MKKILIMLGLAGVILLMFGNSLGVIGLLGLLLLG